MKIRHCMSVCCALVISLAGVNTAMGTEAELKQPERETRASDPKTAPACQQCHNDNRPNKQQREK